MCLPLRIRFIIELMLLWKICFYKTLNISVVEKNMDIKKDRKNVF